MTQEFKLNKFKYDHLFSYAVNVDANMDFMRGMPFGTRVTGYVTDGTIWGPKLNGIILPGGGDWSYVHDNGIIDIDCRIMLEADNGDHIYMTYTGRIDLGSKEAAIEYGKGNLPPKMGIQIIPVLETNSKEHDWANRVACFGIGRVDFTTDPIALQYDVYSYSAILD
ncbi:MAG TPA: DUF3237 domain-containing protein [Gallicola sp.]|nr:DUF3237 domain-containing protein [Gallicola sp.]